MYGRDAVHLVEDLVDLGTQGRILLVQVRQDAGRVVSLAGEQEHCGVEEVTAQRVHDYPRELCDD
jgi:hypothetical protein